MTSQEQPPDTSEGMLPDAAIPPRPEVRDLLARKKMNKTHEDDRDELDYPYDLIKYEDPDSVMFVDPNINKPDNLPSLLAHEIDRLLDHKENGRYLHFENEIVGLEGLVKNYHSVGEISDRQAETIFRMFGWVW